MQIMEKLSVVIITYNEERNIRRCLESITEVADEIVVVDSLSTDSTKEICEEFNVNFVEQRFLGYIEQKNHALKFASHNFVLSLDADEALSKELKSSILKAKHNFSASGYSMNRLTNYCGKWVRHCGWYPDKKLRLFNHKLGSWGGINPHDEFFFKEKENINHLKGDLLHYSYYSVDEHYHQAERFSDIAAQAYLDKGKKASVFKLLFSPLIRFIRDYIFLLGFVDGSTGIRICYIQALTTYKKYSKLRKLQKHNS